MEKNKKKNRLRRFNVITFLTFGGTSALNLYNYKSRKDSNEVASSFDKTSKENEIGYEDISIIKNETVNTNNFVVLHGDLKSDVGSLIRKIEMCNNNNISIGLVLDSEASTLSEVYKEVDFLQTLVKEYTIDFPIYCNIDNIMGNSSLDKAQKIEILNAFLDKITRSDMYVGLYGTDTNLNDCNNYVMDISSYDCFLVQDSKEIKYQETYNIIKDLNGNIKSYMDLSKVINEKNLNESHNLVFSKNYKVKEGDTFHSVALKNGLSEDDLRNYNDIEDEELFVGQIISIPNSFKTVNNKTEGVKYNYAIARGIDISNYQDRLNWDRISETSEFVIVEVARDKANYIENKPEYINESVYQIKNVLNKNIELGLYFCITKDMKISVYEERLEYYLNKLDQDLLSNNINLDRENIPVFLDFEVYYQYNDYYKLMTSFKEICNKHGFKKVGIYGNQSTLTSISKSLEKDGQNINIKDTDWLVWLAGGSQYSTYENTDSGLSIDELKEPENISNNYYTPDMIQATNVCKDTGAANTKGNCDVNFCYSTDIFDTDFGSGKGDYTETISINLNQYIGLDKTKIVNAISSYLMAISGVILAVEVVGKYILIKIRKQKKNKTKVKEK